MESYRSGSSHTVEDLLERSNDIVFQAHSIFPLDIVPDHLIIDRSKVVVIFRELLGVYTEHTILLNEIRDVDTECDYFVGTLKILVSGPGVLWTTITNLRKRDTIKARDIINGLLIAQNEQCDLRFLNHDEMVHTLVELGSCHTKS